MQLPRLHTSTQLVRPTPHSGLDPRRPTDLDNLTLLCRYHHTHFLQKGWTCRINTDGLPEWIPPWWIDQHQRPQINARIRRLNAQRQQPPPPEATTTRRRMRPANGGGHKRATSTVPYRRLLTSRDCRRHFCLKANCATVREFARYRASPTTSPLSRNSGITGERAHMAVDLNTSAERTPSEAAPTAKKPAFAQVLLRDDRWPDRLATAMFAFAALVVVATLIPPLRRYFLRWDDPVSLLTIPIVPSLVYAALLFVVASPCAAGCGRPGGCSSSGGSSSSAGRISSITSGGPLLADRRARDHERRL